MIKIAGLNIHPWPLEHSDELQEAKTHIAYASILFAYTLTRVSIMIAETLPHGSPAAAIVDGESNIVVFTIDGWTKFCTTPQQRAFVITHELYHIFFQHHNRRIDMHYHPLIWNYATDYYINLKASGMYLNEYGNRETDDRYSKHYHFPSGGGLLDERYLGMTCDEIYEELVNEIENNDDPDAHPIDMSGYNDAGDMGANASYSDIIGDGGTDKKRRENEQTLSGAATVSKIGMTPSTLAGSIEGDLVRMVEGMMRPTIRWEDRFENTVRSRTRTRSTYTKWNKLSTIDNDGVIFPSYMGESINLVYGIDSSGSMCEESHREARSELYGLLNSLDAWTVDVVCCDVTLHEMGKFSNEDGDDWDDIEFAVRGMGGTSLSPIIDYANQAAHDSSDGVNAIIIVTDGYFDSDELDNAITDEIPVIVVVVKNGKKDFAMKNCEVIHIN